MNLTINGETSEFDSPRLSVADLLARLELPRVGIAVERNRKIVPRATYDQVELADGDQLEIVTLVGGG